LATRDCLLFALLSVHLFSGFPENKADAQTPGQTGAEPKADEPGDDSTKQKS